MTTSSRSPRHDSDTNEPAIRDPFATPPIVYSTLPARPEPAAYVDSHERSIGHSRPALPHTHSQHDSETFPTKSASMSSAGTKSTTPTSSIDLEKAGGLGREEGLSRKQRQSNRDPEKAVYSPSRHSRYSRERYPGDDNGRRVAYLEDEDMEESQHVQEENALKILLFLAGPCAILSFLNALWTILSLVITLMTQPVRLCARRPSFSQQLGGLVGPALNLQLKSIFTPLPPHADEDTSYRSGMLVLVMLLSPFLSMAMMLAAWVAAIYWVSSAVVGDPAGLDKRDDGRETVLTLRKWWENWLVKSMREET
ncbi:hypothetical protein Slin15195_G004100 [Septoria linicola]|uniref:Uncharacterized protein n=1 Tax=Septoria linicola TaxID=215465 RepID=A0A9Q9AJJ5_9PEZI|nr:hypothetical protein Slin14017_G004130 [Septoria linicola]USW47091.1 hypothetical protein Slin15195_G004100 [Septoria linicola]